MTVPVFLFSLNNLRKKELKVKMNVKDSINFLMRVSALLNNSKKKLDSWNLPTANLKMSSAKLKRIMNVFLMNLRLKKPLFLKLTEESNSWPMRKVNLRKKLPRLKENVIKARENTRTSAKPLKMLHPKTKILLENLKILKILSELVKENLTNQLLREKTSEKSTLILPTKTKCWTTRSINAFWAFWTTKEWTRISKRKSKTTLNATNKLEICSTGRKLCDLSSIKSVLSSKRPKNKSHISADNHNTSLSITFYLIQSFILDSFFDSYGWE